MNYSWSYCCQNGSKASDSLRKLFSMEELDDEQAVAKVIAGS